ncbi:MAG TPA: DUF1801 domain-containing protein [Thermoleophilia bacterium]|nr:DUF1801 domain-containing protein [Thermoleophilia bacterium]
MAPRTTTQTIDDYIDSAPPHTQGALRQLRALIKEEAPEATERISYAVPTFALHGPLVHFAGYEGHIGFYPGPSGVAAFEDELKRYKTSKGSIRLPLDEPLPTDLLRRIVAFRVGENTGKGRG